MQALSLLALAPIAATTADPNSYGLRKERSGADAMEQGATVLSNSTRPQWRLAGDITSCFDTSSQAWLLTHIPMDKAILSPWLQAGYMDKSVLYETEDGTPQGGWISPVLANMTLDGLETRRLKKSPPSGVRALKGKKKQVNLVRDADDGAPRAQGRPKGPPERATVQPMRDGPSESACRSRFQTPSGCCGQKPWE